MEHANHVRVFNIFNNSGNLHNTCRPGKKGTGPGNVHTGRGGQIKYVDLALAAQDEANGAARGLFISSSFENIVQQMFISCTNKYL